METLILIIFGVLGLWLAWVLAKYLANGAIILFGYAGKQEFLGFVAYFAAWVFLLPFMLIACLVVGLVAVIHDNQLERDLLASAKVAKVGGRGGKKDNSDRPYKDATDFEKKRGF
jgi:uncharacterized membrane protein YhdT